MKHELEIELPYYWAARNGYKPFEIRFNDRGYQKGDTVVMTPVNKDGTICGIYPIIGEITYVTSFSQRENWVVFGVRYE